MDGLLAVWFVCHEQFEHWLEACGLQHDTRITPASLSPRHFLKQLFWFGPPPLRVRWAAALAVRQKELEDSVSGLGATTKRTLHKAMDTAAICAGPRVAMGRCARKGHMRMVAQWPRSRA